MQVNAWAALPGWFEANRRSVLILFALIVLFAVFIPAGLTLFNRFPASYVWTELMINYQGGLVRRGLLGEAAFRLDGLVPAGRFLAAVMVGLYLVVGAWIVLRIGTFPEFATVLFLISPATLLFPIYDFEAFGRKDIVALAAFVLSVLVIERLSRNVAVLVIVIVYFVAGLIAEVAWFYFPLAISMLTIKRRADISTSWQVTVWAVALACLAAFFAWMWLINANVQREDIVAAWKAIYPNAFREPFHEGALRYLHMSFADGVRLVFYHQADRITRNGYLIGFVLAALPSLLFLARSPRYVVSPLTQFGLLGALSIMMLSFAVAADWGRCIYLATTHFFVFVLVTARENPGLQRTVNAAERPAGALLVTLALVALYATTWRIDHFAPRGSSALKPGILFDALGIAR